MIRKTTLFLVVALLVMGFVSVPATAGVGGCRPIPGVGGCRPGGGGFFLTANNAPSLASAQDKPQRQTLLDRLGGVLPLEVIIMMHAMFDAPSNTPATQPIEGATSGVGGCGPRFGVGGCKF